METCSCGQYWTSFNQVRVLNEWSVSDGGNLCPLSLQILKSVSMRKPGRTRQEVIQLKSPILLKPGINVGFGE